MEFVLTLEKSFGVRRGQSRTSAAGSPVPYLERTLPGGGTVQVPLYVSDGNRVVPLSRMRQILDRLHIDIEQFEKL